MNAISDGLKTTNSATRRKGRPAMVAPCWEESCSAGHADAAWACTIPQRRSLRYRCTIGINNFRVSPCQSLSGQALDDLVTEKLLKALEPAALELSLLAADDLQQERRRLDENWKQRLERTRYEADPLAAS